MWAVVFESHIIEVDELPETGEDGAIYSTPQFSAVAVCADGTIIEDIAKANDMDVKHYTAVTAHLLVAIPLKQ